MRNKGWVIILSTILVVMTGAISVDETVTYYTHFGLAKSVPEAESRVPPPSTIQLWFTQIPQDNSVAIRLIDPVGDLIETGLSMQSAEDQKAFNIEVKASLGTGAYTVAWRGIGDDGHVARGDFSFSVDVR